MAFLSCRENAVRGEIFRALFESLLRAVVRSSSWRRDTGEENGDYGESAHQQRKPHRRKPGHRDQKEYVWISDRNGPTHRGPKSSVVHDVPNGEGPKENGGAGSGVSGSEQGNGEQHNDCSGFAKDFEREQTLRKLRSRLGLNVILS